MSADRERREDDGAEELEGRLAKANPFEPAEPSAERVRFEQRLRDTIVAERPPARRPALTRRRVVAVGVGLALVASAGVSVAVLTRRPRPT